MNLNQVTLPVYDMEEATEFYRRMGFLQIVDTPHYARFECPEGASTFSLALGGPGALNGCWTSLVARASWRDLRQRRSGALMNPQRVVVASARN